MKTALGILNKEIKAGNPYPGGDLIVDKFVPVDSVGEKIYQPDVDISVEASYSAEKTLTNKTINGDLEENNLINISKTSVFEINYDDVSPQKVMSLKDVIILSMDVIVLEEWDGTQADNILKIGDDDIGSGDQFITDLGGSGSNVLGTIGIKTEEMCSRGGTYLWSSTCGSPRKKYYPSDSSFSLTITLAHALDCRQGRAVVMVEYIEFPGWGGAVTPSGGFSSGFSTGFN